MRFGGCAHRAPTPAPCWRFEFLVLTAARSGEVRNARREEFDHEGAVWTIPAERMKAGREHRVPLSPRALEVLDEARRRLPGAGTVFPTCTGRTQPHPYMAEAAARAEDRRRAAWFPIELPRLGGGVHRRAARGVRARACSRQLRPRGSRLPAQRPVRPAQGADEDMFTIPTSLCH